MPTTAPDTNDYIEVPSAAVALMAIAEMLNKAIRVDAEHQDDGSWIFKVPTRQADLVRQIVQKASF